MRTPALWIAVALTLAFAFPTTAQNSTPTPPSAHDIAERFAPEFHQALGDHPRYDYITNFNFDGNWRGDDNWVNADETRFPLKAYVYYSVIETKTHYFLHYAVFHPRDYKGGDKRGVLLSELLRQGAEVGGKYDPTGKLGEAALAHENDLEGCLVVVAKVNAIDQMHVVYVETVSHNRYLKYVTAFTVPATSNRAIVHLAEGHPQLYIEPKGHGIEALAAGSQNPNGREILVYEVGAEAGDPEADREGAVPYQLLSLLDDMWPKAQNGANETYGEARDYRALKVQAMTVAGKSAQLETKSGSVGSAFLGKVGIPNAARPPWGWFDGDIGPSSAGEWFFDPAGTIKKHFGLGEGFSTTYTTNEFVAGAPANTAPQPAKNRQ